MKRKKRMKNGWRVVVVVAAVFLIGASVVYAIASYKWDEVVEEYKQKIEELEKEREELKKKVEESSSLISLLEKKGEEISAEAQKKIKELKQKLISLGDLLRPPDPPGVVGTVSHQEMTLFLRLAFPKAYSRGAEQQEFAITSKEEIQRFLEKDDTDKQYFVNSSDYVFRLCGQFTRSGWDMIPVGWLKGGKDEFLCVVVVKECGELKILVIDPKTDGMRELSEDEGRSAKYVLVG